MRAVLRLEIIGDNYLQRNKLIEEKSLPYPRMMREMINVIRYGQRRLRPWVARVTGLDDRFGFAREFIIGMRDYSQANSIGSFGVYEYFALTPGIYEVNESVELGKTRRYFVRVQNGEIVEISANEVFKRMTPRDPRNPGWD